MPRAILFASSLALLTACSAQIEPQANAQAAPPTPLTPAHFPDAPYNLAENIVTTTVADGLDYPWGMAFLPNGDYLVTEKYGVVKRISASGTHYPIANSPEAVKMSQGGLQDIALSPDFDTDQTVFVAYSYGSSNENGLAVMRAKLVDDRFEEIKVIYQSELRKGTRLHYGGRLLFMPDGNLMVTIGEGSRYREKSQKLDSDYGKTLRMTRDGDPAPGNPDLGPNALPHIYSYGHRNAQGIIYDAQTGNLWTHEHGPQGGDELNLMKPALNYGWPVATYGIEYTGGTVSPFTQYKGMQSPNLHWTPSIAPSGLTVYRGDLFPQWDGDLFVGALKFNRVHRLEMDGSQIKSEEIIFDIGERVRDVRTGPDGAIYVLTDSSNGKVLKITPAP